MKKFILTSPFLLLSSIFITVNLNAASCNYHKNKKNVEIECSINDDNCNDLKLQKVNNRVDV